MNEHDLVGERSELLARVLLTRRLNVNVHNFGDKGNQGIDLICTIRDDNVKGFLPFGVVVWGTSKPIENQAEADSFGRHKLKGIKDTVFLMPVIVLLFSMQKDEGYFSWLVEPCKTTDKLKRMRRLKFRLFTPKLLDIVTRRIIHWYGRMRDALMLPVGQDSTGSQSDRE